MLIIRLQRVGRTNRAEFRVIVTEHARAAKTGGYLEVLGNYNPHTDKLTVDAEKVKEYMAQGAQVSPTVHNLFVTEGIISGKKINVLPKKTPIVKEQPAEEPTAEAAPVEPAAPEAETSQAEETPAPATA